MKRIWILIVACALCRSAIAEQGEPPVFRLSLAEALAASLETSASWQAARAAAQSAQESAWVAKGSLWPSLSLDGSYRYVTEVPQLRVTPLAPPVSFTTHNSYSIGPTLAWTPFAGGALRYGAQAAEANARAQAWQAETVKRRIRLASRLAYFQTQLAAEEVRLYTESLRVEQAQAQDIENRYRAGAASKLDFLTAHHDVLTRQNQLIEARSHLSHALAELSHVTQRGLDFDTTWPLGGDTPLLPEPLMAPPTVRVALESLPESLARMTTQKSLALDRDHPSLLYFQQLAQAAEAAAKSTAGGWWPTLHVLAGLSHQYPNGPLKESVDQKTVGASLNFPLWNGGSTRHGILSQRRLAEAQNAEREQTARDLYDSWHVSHDAVVALNAQRRLHDQSVQEAAAIARLQYESYQAGRSRFLDVENANLRVLQAKVQAAQTDVQWLSELANLESLAPNPKE